MTTLSVQKRTDIGKKTAQLRERGFIPAEVYGKEIDNKHVQVERKKFEDALKEAGESSIVTLVVDKESLPVLINDISRDPLGEIIHIDFYAVKMGEKMRTDVALQFVGEAPAVKEKGGILLTPIDTLEIEALPSKLPHSIEVDVSGLEELHTSIHIKDLIIPEGVKVLDDPEMAVASIIEPRRIEEDEKVEEGGDEGEEGEAEGEEKSTEGKDGEGGEEKSSEEGKTESGK